MAAARGGLVAGSRSSALPLGRAEARWLRSQRKEWRDGRPAWFGVMESHGCSALRARNQGAFVWSMLAQARCVCVRPGPRVADGAAQSGPAAPAPSTGPRSGWATRGIRGTRRGQRRCRPPTPRAARGPALRRQRPHVFEWGDTHEPDAPCTSPSPETSRKGDGSVNKKQKPDIFQIEFFRSSSIRNVTIWGLSRRPTRVFCTLGHFAWTSSCSPGSLSWSPGPPHTRAWRGGRLRVRCGEGRGPHTGRRERARTPLLRHGRAGHQAPGAPLAGKVVDL